MKALVHAGPHTTAIQDRPMPVLDAPMDAIVRMTRTTICGTDLHLLEGDVPTCEPGRILGHEGVGVVESVGADVTAFQAGDAVLISCVSAFGKCSACRRQMYSHCATGGWILGSSIDGTQAEYVRIPHADVSLYPIPEGADGESKVMPSDILPTGLECGVLNGRVQPGGTVAIVGAGPVGLAARPTAKFYSPAQIITIDLEDARLAGARQFGATHTANSRDGLAAEAVMKITDPFGVDTAIEAVGIPATFGLCQEIIAAGGTIANVGVHGRKVDLHLETLWDRNITITTRLVDTVSTPMRLKTLCSHQVGSHCITCAVATEVFRADEAKDRAAVCSLHTRAVPTMSAARKAPSRRVAPESTAGRVTRLVDTPVSTAPRASPPVDSDSNAIRAGCAEAPLIRRRSSRTASRSPASWRRTPRSPTRRSIRPTR